MRSYSVVVPGNHDGVHLGHQSLINAAQHIAAQHGWRVIALTFEPHPVHVLYPERAKPRLTHAQRKAELLRAYGARDVVAQVFNKRLASMTPEMFVHEVLVSQLNTKAVVVGPDYHFGTGRTGDISQLQSLGTSHDFKVHTVAPLHFNEQVISTSRIRGCLEQGQLTLANHMLGRAHELDGTVIRGDGRGKQLGFPTANLHPADTVQPANGVYAIAARRLSQPNEPILFGVANLGQRPTFNAGRSIEAHLFNFNGDLVAEPLRMAFIEHLRDEKKFSAVSELQRQIQADIAAAKTVVQNTPSHLLRFL